MRPEPHDVTPRPGRTDRNRTAAGRRRETLRRASLEALEARQLLATLPEPAVASSLSTIVSGSRVAGDQVDPSVDVSPNDPMLMVSAWAGGDGTAAFSTDGGASWTPIAGLNGLALPSVAIDRADNAYIFGVSGTTPVLSKLNVGAAARASNGGNPTVDFLNRDLSAALGGVSDPVVVVDDTLGNYTDPQSLATINNPTAGALHLGYVSGGQVRVASSFDGGQNFDAPVAVGTGTAPRLAVSQGTSDGRVRAGQVTALWLNGTTIQAEQVAPSPGASAVDPDMDGVSTVGVAGAGVLPTVASDNTLGSFSPFQGRLYAAFGFQGGGPASNTDIALVTSDDGGRTWARRPGRVNDDVAAVDGFSEGSDGSGRLQRRPQVAVDQSTGTLVMAWRDARHDAENVRVATFVGASIDGGRSFSDQVFVNTARTAIDATDGRTVVLGPQPDDTFGPGLGGRFGLVAAAGRAVPVWSGNENVTTVGTTVVGQDIFANRVTFGAGPRVVSSTMGPIEPGSETLLAGSTPVTFNARRAADGTPILDGLVIALDRPVDPSSFTPGDIQVFFRDTTAANGGGVVVPVVAVEPLVDADSPLSASRQAQVGASRYLVRVAPTSGVGTYSYAVGPQINDRIRSATSTGNLMDQDADGVRGEDKMDGVGPGDVYAVPRPTARGSAFDVAPPNSPSTVNYPAGFILGPYDRDTLPIILNGPVQTTVTVPGEPTGGTLALDRKVGALDVAFDRLMIARSVSAADVVRVDGPGGPIEGPFSVRPVFRSAAAASPIADGGSITTSIVVPDDGGIFRVGDLDVRLDIAAPRAADLQVVLIAPDGTRIVLARRVGGASGRDFTGTVFDDGTDLVDGRAKLVPAITEATAPFTGRFSPQQPLSSLAGLQMRGTWRLEVTDLTANDLDPGALQALLGWSMAVDPLATVPGDPQALAQEFRVDFFRPGAGGLLVPDLQQVSGTYSVELSSDLQSARGQSLDQDRDAGLDLLRGFSPGAGTIPFPRTSPNAPVVIADASPTNPGTTSSTLTIAEDFLVQSLTVQLDIQHPRVGDLTIVLRGPDGSTATLFSPEVARVDGANLSGVTFDENAATYIGDAGPPYLGTFRPQEPISRVFLDEAGNFKRSTGVYTLEVTDSASGPAGPSPSLTRWGLTFARSPINDGLGEEVADRAEASFRVFTMAKADPVSSTSWTPVGPAPVASGGVNGQGLPVGTLTAGRVTAIAVDPADPTGNTVYIGADGGGIWRTHDFLAAGAEGPTWLPLTDFGPNLAVNIGSITILPRNDDPSQSIIIAGTGNGADLGSFGGRDQTSLGVGFLRSVDGGRTWEVIDSTVNVDTGGDRLPLNDPARDRLFVNDSIFKIAVDPTPISGDNYAVYAAVTGINGGLWRSDDTGDTWRKISDDATHGTQATDVILDPFSRDETTGQLDRLYAGFRGNGVFLGTSRGENLTVLLDGGTNNPLRQAPGGGTIPVGAPVAPPAGGRFTLAQPSPVASGASNLFYQDWLYAAAVEDNGDAVLYVTKDRGDLWTRVQLPANALGLPSNDVILADRYDAISGPNANAHLTLAVDPNDPNVVYLGAQNLVRVDLTQVHDANSLVFLDPDSNDPAFPATATNLQPGLNDAADSAALLNGGPFANLTDALPRVVAAGGANLPTIGDARTGQAFIVDGQVVRQALNLSRNPVFPLAANATFTVSNTASFANTGADARWTQPFDELLGGASGVPSQAITSMFTLADPLTGAVRLLVGTDHGVYTGAIRDVDGDGSLDQGIGSASSAIGDRIGNLQIARLHYGAVQPSSLAAQAAGALFYGMGARIGFPESDPNILQNGQLAHRDGDPFALPARNSGSGVATAQVDGPARGALYQFKWPFNGGRTSDFFQVNDVGRTVGLLDSSGGSTQTGRWPTDPVNYPLVETGVPFGNFAVNPLNNDQAVIGAADGTLFGTVDQGRTWRLIGQRAVFGGGPNPGAVVTSGYAQAVAFGAPDPGVSAPGQLDDFIYVGTARVGLSDGEIYVTRTGGGAAGNQWANISGGLDGSTVMAIAPNTVRGARDAYAVTHGGASRSMVADDFDDNTGQVPDGTTKPTTVTFPLDGGGFRVSNLAVTVDITHTGPDPAGATNDIREIDLFLVSPAGTRVRLTPVGGVPGDAFSNTTFDDRAGTGTLDTGASPYTGTFRAAEPLSAFYGEQLQGTWSLEVVDRLANGETATVNDVQITASSLGGVFYNPDTTAPGSSWAPIGGGLVNLQQQAFGDPLLTEPAVKDGELHALAVDWRYRLPDASGTPRPVLYVAGYGGVFRSIDNGQTWTEFPDNIPAGDPENGSPADDGHLPNVRVTDLDLGLGFINPDTGQHQVDPNTPAVLLATTFGRGQFAIRLAPIVAEQSIGLSDSLPAPDGSDSGIGLDPNSFTDLVTNVTAPVLDGFGGPISGFANTTRVTLYDLTDPGDVRVIGGFDPDAPNALTSAPAIGRTDARGEFVHDETFEASPASPSPIPGNGSVARSVLTVGPAVVGEDGATIPLPASATVTDVDVRVSIDHPRPSDLRLSIVAERPDGLGGITRTVVPLATNLGVSFDGKAFDDNAPTPIGRAPSSANEGRFRPEGSLADFNGLAAGGTWVLEVVDSVTGEVGTIEDWTLFLRTSTSRVLPGVRVLPGHFREDGSTDGLKTIGILLTDDSGVTSPMAEFQFTLDTTPPMAPAGLDLQSGSDTGLPPVFSDADEYTADATPTFDVSGVEAENGVLLYRNGQRVAELFGTAGGVVAITDPGLVPDGTYTYVAVQVDRSGNESPISNELVVTIDTVDPQTPSVPSILPADDSGIPGDGTTNVQRPRLTGSLRLAPNETTPENLPLVQIIGPAGSVLGQARAGADGVYTVLLDEPLEDGVFSVRARAVDRAGNPSADGPILSLRIDTSLPSGVSFGLSPVDDTGTVGDDITSIRRPRLIGVTGAGLQVELIDVNGNVPNSSPGAVVGASVTYQANGAFTLQFPFNLPDGTYTLRARVTNAAGNSIESDPPLVLTILNQVDPEAPTFRLDPASDTGLKGDGRTVERRPFFIGESTPNTAVEIIGPNGDVLASGTTDAQGNYRLRLASNLTNGSIVLRARTLNTSGVPGPFSAPLSLRIASDPGDYDNDGRADLALYRPGSADGESQFLILRSTLGGRAIGGVDFRPSDPTSPLADAELRPGDIPVTGDFDGDGIADAAVYRPESDRQPGASEWLILGSRTGPRSVLFGGPGLDVPAAGDFDGDGITDIAVFRPESDLLPGAAEWFILPSASGQAFRVTFGGSGGLDVPAVGDFDGDGRADIAVFRPSSDLVLGASQWFILPSGPNDLSYSQKLGGYPVLFGEAGVDQPVPGDYDGDGRSDIATYRPSTSEWFFLRSSLPHEQAGFSVTFGTPGDIPAPADYDGDGITDLVSFRPSAGQWTIRQSTDAQVVLRDFGADGDIPVLSPLGYRDTRDDSIAGPVAVADSRSVDQVGQARQVSSTSRLDLGRQASRLSSGLLGPRSRPSQEQARDRLDALSRLRSPRGQQDVQSLLTAWLSRRRGGQAQG
jgi:subtilisin-like proprotein convertase family protein